MTEELNQDVVWEGKKYLLSRDPQISENYIIWMKDLNYINKVGVLANRTEKQAIYEVKQFFEENDTCK